MVRFSFCKKLVKGKNALYNHILYDSARGRLLGDFTVYKVHCPDSTWIMNQWFAPILVNQRYCRHVLVTGTCCTSAVVLLKSSMYREPMHSLCLLRALLASSSLGKRTKASPVARPSAWWTNRMPSSPSSTSTLLSPERKNSSCKRLERGSHQIETRSPRCWTKHPQGGNLFPKADTTSTFHNRPSECDGKQYRKQHCSSITFFTFHIQCTQKKNPL